MASTDDYLDSLPYYDDDLQKYPYLRQKVDQELARELKKVNQGELHPKVPPPVELFTVREHVSVRSYPSGKLIKLKGHPLLKIELERARKNEPLPALDTLRYQLPAPTSTPGSDEEWKAALDNARAQLQHQKLRQSNLALLQTYGPNAHRIQNYLQEAATKHVEKVSEDLKQLTVEVNRERKNDQERLGKQLTSLETRWTELISSILQIEMANTALDAEIDRLNKREAELAEQLS